MITKDQWITEARVAAECEKLVAEGIAPDAINANMIIDRLQTKGRGTVYKYVPLWRDKRAEQTVLAPFNLSPEMTQQVVALFTTAVGDAVANERQTAVDAACLADRQVALMKQQVDDLLKALEATEQERDEANEQSIQLDEKLKAALIDNEALRKIAQDAKTERNDVYAKFLPWQLANGHPEIE